VLVPEELTVAEFPFKVMCSELPEKPLVALSSRKSNVIVTGLVPSTPAVPLFTIKLRPTPESVFTPVMVAFKWLPPPAVSSGDEAAEKDMFAAARFPFVQFPDQPEPAIPGTWSKVDVPLPPVKLAEIVAPDNDTADAKKMPGRQ
jgi:hypothetical protein